MCIRDRPFPKRIPNKMSILLVHGVQKVSDIDWLKGELRCKNGLFSKKRAVRKGSILTLCLVFWSFLPYIVWLRSRKSNLDFRHLGRFLSRVGLTSSCLWRHIVKVDSQPNPSGCGAVLLRGHIWIVFRGWARNRQHGFFSSTSLSCTIWNL